jgi:hypothetical protein
MFRRNPNATIGSSLFAAAMLTGHEGIDYKGAYHWAEDRHPHGVPSVTALRLLNASPSRLPGSWRR